MKKVKISNEKVKILNSSLKVYGLSLGCKRKQKKYNGGELYE